MGQPQLTALVQNFDLEYQKNVCPSESQTSSHSPWALCVFSSGVKARMIISLTEPE